MNRRNVIRLSGAVATLGIAGCSQFIPSKQTQLWFVRIHNGTPERQEIVVRVRYSGNPVFEHQYQIPSFKQDPPQDEGTFAGMDSARLISDSWEIRPGEYDIEYKLAQDGEFQRVNVEEVDDGQPENVGVNMQVLGGNMNPTSVGVDVLEFDSEGAVTDFLTQVTNETT